MIMDNQNSHINTFINNQGFAAANNLPDLLGNDDEAEEMTKITLSPYIDMHALSDKLYESKSNFSILSLNAQSINAKFDEFQIAINEINNKHEVSIICIQESWLSSDSDTSLFDIPNYQLVAKGKYCSNHGGLLTYVHKDFYWENIAINDETTVWENLFIKVRHKTPGSKTQIVGNIYRRPNEILHDFRMFQEEFVEALENFNRNPVYLCGDFNIDLLKLNVKDHYHTFFNNLIAAGYFPRISLPTRITNHSATLLDNIFTNELGSHQSGILVNNISDHQMIYTYNTTQIKSTSTSSKKFIEVETNNRQAMDRFLIQLRECNIMEKLNLDNNANPNNNFEHFMELFMKLKQQYLPKRVVRFNRKKHKIKPWLTTGILNSINSKDKLYKTLVQTPKDSPIYSDLLSNFKVYKNIIRRSIMHAKRDYYKNVFRMYSSNLKKTWQTINDSLNRRNRRRDFPQEFQLANGTLISEPKHIANAFNDFFINVGDTGPFNTNVDFNQYMPVKPNCNLTFQPITVDITSRIIDSLKPKTSTGVDCISNKLLKYVRNVISEPLTIIINQMLNMGVFPDLLKISKVIPIYKKEDDTMFSNYRPISLLPSISKIFEKVILEQLTTYLNKNNLIHKHQYGFRKNYSTEYASLHIVDYLNYEMDKNRTPTNIYLDLSKAFDSLSHYILLNKLQHYGLCDVALNLLKSYLTNRKQFVQYNEYSSDMKYSHNGVPQGSILGPLLFLIYINDLPNSSELFNFLMYADDTTLYCCLEDITSENKAHTLNIELEGVHSWLKANRLTLNVNKTKYMLFSKRKNNLPGEINLQINNNDIQSVTEFNFLGLYLNSKLNWDTHINVIGKKISRAVGIIKKLQLIFPQKILISLYNTLLLPHINYCLLSWGSSNAAESIFLQQKKAIRAISSASHNAHTEPLFKIFNILKLNDIFNYRLLTFYYNLRHNKVPHYIATFLPNTSIAINRYPIRKARLQPPLYVHEYIPKTCKHKLPVYLNSINSNNNEMSRIILITDKISLPNFKNRIKMCLLESYSYYCDIPNCYICDY